MIQSITLELRPRLQTCNASICLKKKVNSAKVGIKLLEGSLEITVGNKKQKFLTDTLKLIPNSLSALSITNNWVCFRVQTKSDSAFGSFQTEIVTNLTPKIAFLKDSSDNTENTDLLHVSDCKILCTCCKNVITKEVFVKRLLPVPDMNYDPSDWFCCKHSHSTITQNLTPVESDIFYGPLFYIIHSSSFNKNVKVNGNTVICNRCLQYLGKVHANNSLKLWSCSIDYYLLNNTKIKNATNPFNDFLIAVKNSMTGIFGEEIILQSFMGKEIHCLILKPMDWNLNLMIEPKTISNGNTVILQGVPIVKVLYKYETNNNIVDSANKTYCEVGFPVLKVGLEHLLTSTKRFSELHRVASDYYIGHIYLEKPTNET